MSTLQQHYEHISTSNTKETQKQHQKIPQTAAVNAWQRGEAENPYRLNFCFKNPHPNIIGLQWKFVYGVDEPLTHLTNPNLSQKCLKDRSNKLTKISHKIPLKCLLIKVKVLHPLINTQVTYLNKNHAINCSRNGSKTQIFRFRRKLPSCITKDK